jgi:hypothetical protein
VIEVEYRLRGGLRRTALGEVPTPAEKGVVDPALIATNRALSLRTNFIDKIPV